MFDIDPWLRPLDGENPSGESLRDDPLFHELERLTQPRIEVARDERNNPIAQTAVPVDWAEVLRQAEALRPRGRDLRLLVIVTRALANERGLTGLRDGLTLIAHTLADHWESLHPELRDGPSRDAARRRINALAQLQADPEGLLGDLRGLEMMAPRGVGRISGRDLERGVMSVQAVLAAAPRMATEADKAALAAAQDDLLSRVGRGCKAEAETNPEGLARTLAEARAAEQAGAAVETALHARLGDAPPALADLAGFLAGVAGTLERAVTAAADPAPVSTQGMAADAAPVAGALTDPLPAGLSGGFPDRLASREEVVKCLDLVIAFYDRTEPSSPIPHLVRRIRRMVPMDFLQLMEDLAPSGLKEFRLLAGVPDAGKQRTKGETA